METMIGKKAIICSMLAAFVSCGGPDDQSTVKVSKRVCLETYQSVNGWSVSKIGRFTDAEILTLFYRSNNFGCSSACYNDLRVGNDMPAMVTRTVTADGSVDGELLPGVGAHAAVSDSTTSDVLDPAATRTNKFVVSGSCQLSTVVDVDAETATEGAKIGPITDEFNAALLAYQTKYCSKAKGEWAAYNKAKNKFECVSSIKATQSATHGRPGAGDGAAPAATSCPAQGGCPDGQFKQKSGYCATYASYPAYRNCQ